MTDAAHDPLLRRAIDELQRLPQVDPAAVHRVITVAAAARVSPADEPLSADLPAPPRRLRLWSALGLAAAAAIVGFVARGVWSSRPTAEPVVVAAAASAASADTAPGMMRAAAGVDRSRMPIPQQFVIENPGAHRISVVGDFNNWNPTAAPMTRSPQGRLWSAEIPILPGRHVYGFMVDDSLFVLDPRAPKARDPEFGAEGSVMLVGRP